MEMIPITPEVMRWARETAGLTAEDVADKIKKTSDVITEWEEGEASPTYVQLEKLAYDIYKRPLAIFFFPQPPKEDSPKKSFRTLPDAEIDEFSPAFLKLFRHAQAMQINLSELLSEEKSKEDIVNWVNFSTTQKIGDCVKDVRSFLKISLDDQKNFRSVDRALKIWRKRVEECGIFVFKEAFKDNSISGFCLYDDDYPIIYINNSMPKTRQIFTLFHELAHILFNVSGIDKSNDKYIDYLSGTKKKIEVMCNQFAGEFLVPSSDFRGLTKGEFVTEKFIEYLSDKYKVSREVILRKFYDMGTIGQSQYNKLARKWQREWKNREKGSGGNYYATQASYLGETYLDLVFGKYYKNKISHDQVTTYLNVKETSVAGLEHIVMTRRGQS